MSRTVKEVFVGRNAIVTLLLVVGVFMVVGFACSSSAPPPAEYVGSWTGDDGTTMTISSEGTADYKSKNVSVDSGSIAIDENAKTLKISYAGIGPSFTIDKPPTDNQMTLSGVVFKRSDSHTTSNSKSDTNSSEPAAKVPSNDKLQQMVKTTMNDFSNGVRSGDFSGFRNTFSKKFKDSVSDDDLRAAFKDFIEQKDKFDVGEAISKIDATFEPSPSIVENSDVTALKVAGYYPTRPTKLMFKFDYTMEDGSWKPSFVKLDIGNGK